MPVHIQGTDIVLGERISAQKRAAIEQAGALSLAQGGHDWRYRGSLYSVFCECGAWMGESRSGGPRSDPDRNKEPWGFGRCPLAGDMATAHTLELPAATHAQLLDLVTRTQSASKTEVIRKALALLDEASKAAAAGQKFGAAYDGQVLAVEIVGIIG